jgi:hypothetical protein
MVNGRIHPPAKECPGKRDLNFGVWSSGFGVRGLEFGVRGVWRRRSVGAAKWCQFTEGNGCEGPQAPQAATDHCCHDRMDIAGRFPGAGGRPLRRRREMLLI